VSVIKTRHPNDNEIQTLQRIWSTAFGTVGMDSFYKYIFNKEMCLVADVKNKPVAMGHLIPNGDIVLCDSSIKCAMIYSVATLPGNRGKGLGTAIVNDLITLSRELGYSSAVLCPSDDELFTYYSQRSELIDWFFVNEQVFNMAPDSSNIITPIKITACEYTSIREGLLKGVVHIKHDLSVLEYQEKLCMELGGGLFRIGDSCAVIERQQDKSIWVKELLTPDLKVLDVTTDVNTVDIIASIAELFPSKEYTIRLPSQSGMWRRFGMLAFPDSLPDSLTKTGFAPWYGIAFD